jgi:heat-inducible transcriptional repressor
MAGGTPRQLSGPDRDAPLGERARRILASIVDDHIHGGEPVGSQAIARVPGVDCSSATVRAVMADLEAMGLLEKPHTSAGRIPTARGYRYYVDALLHLQPPLPAEKSFIETRANEARGEVDGLFAEASRTLHRLTRHAGVVATPRPQAERLRRIEFVQLREGRVLALLISRTGRVQNRLITLDRPYRESELVQAENYLNQLLSDLTLEEARAKLIAEMDAQRTALSQLEERALALGSKAMDLDGRDVAVRPAGPAAATGGIRASILHLEGQASLLEEPTLAHDLDKIRALFKALDEKEQLLSVLDKALVAQELVIFIGKESGIYDPELSIVAAPYRREGEIVGALGVIGPTRMDYSRVIPLVEFTAHAVGLALDPKDDLG